MKNRIIYKYQISRFPETSISMPVNSIFLRLAVQDNEPYMWFMHDPEEKERTDRKFIVRMTGKTFDLAESRYLGSFQLEDADNHWGRFVGHVFEFEESL